MYWNCRRGRWVVRLPDKTPTTEDFTKLGAIIKLDVYDQLSKASFCGLLFDEEDLEIIADPYKIFCNFSWLNSRYFKSRDSKVKMLLRCKALSFKCQYPACPMVTALADYMLRMTRSIDVRGFAKSRRDLDSWTRNQLLDAVAYDWRNDHREIGMNTRLLYEELYNISVEDQIRVESYLANLNCVQPLDIPVIQDQSPESWKVNYDRYVDAVGS